VESSDPRYSFHYRGTADTLYVFEAPIDMLSYITLHKTNWQAHSYVALNGMGDQAMRHLLEKNTQIKKVMLCFDHDPAGIETSDKLTEVLHEAGYEQVIRLQSLFKDWNEDVKAQNGVTPLPAREHPRIMAFQVEIRELADLYESLHSSLNPQYALVEHIQKLRPFLQSGAVPSGKETPVMEQLRNVSANALLAAAREYRQTGKSASPEQLIQQLRGSYHVYYDRSGLWNKAKDIQQDAEATVLILKTPGIRSVEDKQKLIENYMSLALDCVKAHISVDLEQQKQIHNQVNQTTNFNMAM